MTTESQARAVLLEAERQWEVELRATFGHRFRAYRLLSEGHGEEGSALRRAFLAYQIALAEWDTLADPYAAVPSVYSTKKKTRRRK